MESIFAGLISFGKRYRPAMPGDDATGASVAGVPLAGIRSGWLGKFFI